MKRFSKSIGKYGMPLPDKTVMEGQSGKVHYHMIVVDAAVSLKMKKHHLTTQTEWKVIALLVLTSK